MNAIFGHFSYKNIENKNEIIDAVSALMNQRSDNIQTLSFENSFHLNARKNNSLLLCDEDKILINFDGRIDNRNELDFFDPNISDAKNILNLYKKGLMSKVKLFAGPFAFFIINMSTNKIIAYRDQMGVRPLYYFYNKEKFIYSTEIDYIFANSGIKKDINFKKLKYFILTENNKIASMLSGGLDTSSITSAIALAKGNSIEHKTYSIVFNNIRKQDVEMVYETNYIKDVINKYSIDSNIIELDYYNIQDYLKNIQSNYPEPNYHGNKYMDTEMIDAMKSDGHKIILSGFDGDSVITHGDHYLYLLLKNMRFLKFFKEVYVNPTRVGFNYDEKFTEWLQTSRKT